jgi:hypothetical protein
MSKIQSSVIDRAVGSPERDSPIVEGIYGTNGFYFQVHLTYIDVIYPENIYSNVVGGLT